MAEKVLKPLAAVVFFGLFAVWFAKFPSPKDYQIYFMSALTGVLFSLSYTAFGLYLLKKAGISAEAPLRYPAAFALAYCLWGLVWIIAGFLGIYNPVTAVVLLACSLLLSRGEFAGIFSDIKEALKPSAAGPAYAALAAVSAAALAAVSMAPAVYYDALVYHLAVPSRYIAESRIVEIQGNIFSYFPKLASMNYLFVMLLSGQSEAVKVLQLSAALFTALAVYGLAKRANGSGTAAFLSAVTCVLFFLNATRPGAELPMALLCAVLMMLLFGKDFTPAQAAAASFIAGSLAALKYTGAAPAVFFFAVIIYRSVKIKVKPGLAALCFALFALPAAPYLALNFAWKGGALYPFMSKIPDAAEYVSHVARFGPQKNIALFFTAPFTAVMNPLQFGGDALSPLFTLIMLLLPALLFIREARPYAAFLAVYYVIWFFSGSVLRFLMPALPAVYVLAGIAAGRAGSAKHALIAVTALLQLGASLYYAEKYIKPFSVLHLSRQEYLASRLSYAPAADFLNKTASKEERVLILGDARAYYIRNAAYSFTVFDREPARQMMSALSGEAGARYFENNKISYVLLNIAELERLKDSGYGEIRDFVMSKAFKKLVDTGFERIYSDAGCEIFRVKKGE